MLVTFILKNQNQMKKYICSMSIAALIQSFIQ